MYDIRFCWIDVIASDHQRSYVKNAPIVRVEKKVVQCGMIGETWKEL